MDPRVLQWNSQSIRNKKPELIYLINKYKPIVFAIAETWLKPGSRFRVPGYSCFRDDRNDGYAGCALLIDRTYSFSVLPVPNHSPGINIIAAKTLNTTFISVYIPHPSICLLQELNNIISSITGPYIILGDFNCKNSLWGSPSCDSNSYALLDMIDNLNLCVMNDGSATRRVSPLQQASALDLTLSSATMASAISWRVLSRSYGSDHFPILSTILKACPPPPVINPLLKYKTAQADWSKYSCILEDKIKSLCEVNNENFLETYSKFIDSIIQSADASIPIKNTVRNRIPSPPWWDPECTNIIRERNISENTYSKNLTLENYLLFQKTLARSKRFLAKKKTEGWLNFCKSLSPRSPSALVWRKVKSFRRSLTCNDPLSNDTDMWLPDFVDKLSPPFVPSEDLFPLPSTSLPSDNSDRMNEPFSFPELLCAIDHLKDTSPGVDGIPYSFVTRASNITKRYFLNIINHVFFTGMVPDLWKIQIVIPILKPGKNPNDSSSYRPIALSSVLAKILEHLIKNRLEWILENRKILARSQFGFRRGTGTIDSLSILTTDIRIAFSNNENVVAVFLDIAAAYDNVDLALLRQKMQQLSIPSRITNVICNLFMARFIRVRTNGSLLPPRPVWKGLPQGSVLSPILYSLYTYDLESTVDSFCSILQYADDIVLYATSALFKDCETRLNSALFYLNVWLGLHGLSLSISKCKSLAFSRKRNIPHIDLSLDDQVIEVVESVKFLGVFLDSKMTGITHLNYIASKCEKSVNVMRSLSGVRWGAHPYMQKILYNAIVRSHFDYASFILEPCNKLALAKLDRIQAKCLRIITGAMKSSPINALQVECVDPPLILRRQYLSDRFFLNIAQYQSHPLLAKCKTLSDFSSSSGYWRNKETPPLVKSFKKYSSIPLHQLVNNPIFCFDYDTLIFQPPIILHLGINKKSANANSEFNQIMDKKFSGWLQIFTDASKITPLDCVGSAVWIPKYKIILNFKSPPQSSIFTGEAVALYEAVSYVSSHNLNKSIILTDSLSCLQDLIGFPFHSRNNFYLTLKIKDKLRECQNSNIQVILAWIPSHCGITGNEVVDQCAKNAIQQGIESSTNCHPRDLRSEVKRLLHHKWNKLWQISRQTKGKHYGSLQPNIPIKPWFFKNKEFTKLNTSTIIRLRLGHICSPVFLAKLRIRDGSVCECGLAEGTIEHILLECPKISFPLYNLLPRCISRPININFLLTLVFSPYCGILNKFLSKNNIRL
jgi:hypothetical protein